MTGSVLPLALKANLEKTGACPDMQVPYPRPSQRRAVDVVVHHLESDIQEHLLCPGVQARGSVRPSIPGTSFSS